MQDTQEADVAQVTSAEEPSLAAAGEPARIEVEVTREELQAQIASLKKEKADLSRALGRHVDPQEFRELNQKVSDLTELLKTLGELSLTQGEPEEEPRPLSPLEKFRQAAKSPASISSAPQPRTAEQRQLLEMATQYGINLDEPAPEDASTVYKVMKLWVAGRPLDALAALETGGQVKQEAAQVARSRREKGALGVKTGATPSMGGGRRTFTAAEIQEMSVDDYKRQKSEIDAALADGRIK